MIRKFYHILLMTLFVTFTNKVNSETIVIRNAISDKVAVEDLRLIFTLRMVRFDNGAQIKVFVLPRDNAITKEFSFRYLGISVTRWWEILDAQEGSGKTNLHTEVATEREMIRSILRTPNSVGYADETILIHASSGDVHILRLR